MRTPTPIEAISLCRPSHLRAAVRGLCRRSDAVHPLEVHLAAAMEWLSAAASACGDRGVSYGYDLTRGFLPPYPETTGYIIPTFYEYADRTGDCSWSRRAGRLADWEIEVQMPSGAVQSGVLRAGTAPGPAVFNTGQVIFGWVESHRRTGERRYLDAAERAGAWLVAAMDDDGCWRRDLSDRATTREQAYNARTAWALALVGQATGESHWVDAAVRNVDWVLRQRGRDGWVGSNIFYPDWPSLTHNIGYVMEGLLGIGRLLNLRPAVRAAERMAGKLMRHYEVRRSLPGGFYPEWKADPRPYRCLTGDAQIVGVWLHLYRDSGDLRYLNAALRLLDEVATTQDLRSRNPGIRGAVGGSFPLHGFYSPLTYVNWAAKFFADSLMVASDCRQELLVRWGDIERGRGANPFAPPVGELTRSVTPGE